ncbi:MAG: Holliday junction resolvase RuvX [Armatimonadetes bacterium]|nr:Holliday junction resolvase RuvX [Armatimonadota bacterium]
MRILGVDYGEKRIGLAIGETEVGMAFARPVLSGTGSREADAGAVAEFARREGCEKVVVGLPLLESGEEGRQAQVSREFGGMIAREGLNVQFQDERYTSVAAEAALGHLKPKRRKAVADSEAARILLTEYLTGVSDDRSQKSTPRDTDAS